MNTLILLKARLKSSLLTKSYLRDLRERKRFWVLPLAGLGIASGIFSILMILIQNYKAILGIGIETGDPGLVFMFSGIFISVLIFFLGTPLCLSNIYYSKDNMLAASLPVTMAEIIISRVIAVYLFILPLHLFLLLPAVVLYIPAAGSIETVISAVVYGITGPVFPLTLSLAAASLLSLAGRRSGYRTAFEITGMLLAIMILGGLQLSFSRALLTGGELSSITGLTGVYMTTLKKIFFASAWTAEGFTRGGWLSLAAGTAFSAASAAAAVLLLRKAGVNLTNNAEGKSRRLKRRVNSSQAVPPAGRTMQAALLRRELKVLLSNSAFIIETVGEVIMLPLLLCIFYFTIPEEISMLINRMTEGKGYLPLLVTGILILINSINSVSSTSISREGSSFSISKSLPIGGRVQVKAKMIFHIILFLSSWYLNLLLLTLILKLPAVHLLYLIPAGPAVILLSFAASIHIDLSRPVLNWTHPQQAMKQNMNVPIGMGFGLLIAAGLLLPAAGLYLLGVNTLLSGFIITAEAVAADIILMPRIFRYADKRYIEILT